MEAEDKVLEHFESVSSDFEAVYEGGQDFWLYKLIDITFRNAILEKRRKLTIDLCGNVEVRISLISVAAQEDML